MIRNLYAIRFIGISMFCAVSGWLQAQHIYNLDVVSEAAVADMQMPDSNRILSQEDVNNIQELASTIDAILFENGEQLNIAKQRGIRCVKADADIPTFLKFTRTEKNKNNVIKDCQDVELIRFSFQDTKDLELAEDIDFSILDKFPQLIYVLFYVESSVFRSPQIDQQEKVLINMLNGFLASNVNTKRIKIFYRIPIRG